MHRRKASSVAILIVFAACTTAGPAGSLSSADSTAIRDVQRTYVAAWLQDDTSGVLATLDSSAVLLPPRQLSVAGHTAIRAYWWPQDGSRTRITNFDSTIDELGGANGVAYTRGVSMVGWTYAKDTVHQVSNSRTTNLTLFRRGQDGNWRITHQMWGPPLP